MIHFVVTFRTILVAALLLSPFCRGDQTADPAPPHRANAYNGMVEQCGVEKERSCGPSHFHGKTMCGYAVSQMLTCMADQLGYPNCKGDCGHGRDFVNCSNGALEKCGYTKHSGTSPECKLPGAVRAYLHTPTKRGSIFGHVEFVCGVSLYCSVYHQPLSQPWPRGQTPNACWYPANPRFNGVM